MSIERREQDGEGQPSAQVVELASLVHGALGHMTPAQRARGLARLGERLQRRRRLRPVRALGWLSAVGAAAALALLVVLPRAGLVRWGWGWSGGAAALAYKVEGGKLEPSGALVGRADASANAPVLRFADGTSVKLQAGGRGRLASVDERGARFSIERGTAEVDVTPRPNARWLFDAGPFLITVHGTTFSAGWDELEGRLDLRLERGLVSVTGPVAGGPIQVRGGQHLTVTLRQARVLLRALAEIDEAGGAGAATAVVAPAAEAPAAAVPAGAAAEVVKAVKEATTEIAAEAAPSERPPAPRAPAARAAGSAAGHATSSVGWVAALAAGDFAAILRDADREGSRALAGRGSDELAALADAARYNRRDELARSALLAQRRRFPHSERARDAAFLLGRLQENRQGGRIGQSGQGGLDGGTSGLAGALKWYDRYLEEAPSGAYASEALGRKMVAVQKLHGTEPARAVAEEYARRFPTGTYAGAAKALRASP